MTINIHWIFYLRKSAGKCLLASITATLLGLGLAAPSVAQMQMAGCADFTNRVLETARGTPSISSDVAVSNWQDNAACLFRYLNSIEASAPLSGETISRLRVISGILRTMIELNPKEFRTVFESNVTYRSARMLVLAASSSEQVLRLNASFVLANIVNPSLTCVIVDHLADPDLARSESGRNGRANLLGILRAMANWADPFTRALMREALAATASQINAETNVETAKSLILDLQKRLNLPIRKPLQSSTGCEGYMPQYAASAFENARRLVEIANNALDRDSAVVLDSIRSLTSVAGGGNAPVAVTAREVFWPLTRSASQSVRLEARRAIRQAYCYQERNTTREPAGRYLVICHMSAELCERTRGPNLREGIRQTSCVLVQREAGFEDLEGDGHDGALFRYKPTAYAEPYPTLPD